MAYILFRIPVGYRLYDREKNKVIVLSEDEFNSLRQIKSGCGNENDRATLIRFQEKGFCCKSELEGIEHPATQKVPYLVNKRITQMILQVTQNCNLRCSYCAYSGSYNNRQHCEKRMSVEIALRAIDFLFAHSSESEEVIIGFYGGEPILEFELIKDVIKYVKEEYPYKKTRFNLTTNLTLLSEEIIQYIISNKIEIMISIDGPQPAQDKHRVFANGRGSYSKVYNNAKRFSEIDSGYFGKCMTNTVISPDSDFKGVKEFLDNNALFGPLNSMVTQVNETGKKEAAIYDDKYYQMIREEKFKLLLAMLGEISFSRVSKVSRNYMAQLLQLYRLLKTNGSNEVKKAHPGGPCIPGQKRVFVDVDGNFYPCERIAEFKNYQIGNLADGFDIEKIQFMINIGKCTESECMECWAFMYCGTCLANMADDGTPTRKMRLQRCPNQRENVLSKLSDIETLKYYGYDFVQVEDTK